MAEAVNRRIGARRKDGVPADVLVALAAGEVETVNLMEWLAADMGGLARVLAAEAGDPRRRAAIEGAADGLRGLGVLARLSAMGDALCLAEPDPMHPWRVGVARHRSDLVRQWACYAANAGGGRQRLADRLSATTPFAADSNMSVREAAWMAFRPHLAADIDSGLAALLPLASSEDQNLRRFAVEVSRPRSVWGGHIAALKRRPEIGLPILREVRADPSRYVRLAAGNWLNDAAKTRPDWVLAICRKWMADDPCVETRHVVHRGTRTIRAQTPEGPPLLAVAAMPEATP